jgi:hypothetical protein
MRYDGGDFSSAKIRKILIVFRGAVRFHWPFAPRIQLLEALMARWNRIGVALVFAATLSGSAVVATPAHAAPARLCAHLADAVERLTELAAKYPDNPLIARFLEAATAAYAEHCQ